MVNRPTIHAAYEAGATILLKKPDPAELQSLLPPPSSVTQYSPDWWRRYLQDGNVFTEKVFDDPRYTAWGVHAYNIPGLPKDGLMGIAGYFTPEPDKATAPWWFTYNLRARTGKTSQENTTRPERSFYIGTEVSRLVVADMMMHIQPQIASTDTYVNHQNTQSHAMMLRLGATRDDASASERSVRYVLERPASDEDFSFLQMAQALGATTLIGVQYSQ